MSSDKYRDLFRSRWAAILLLFARIPRFRGLSMKLAKKFEGGEFRSETLRSVLRKYYDIEIGAYSYGACFKPMNFPGGARVGRYVSIAGDVKALFNHPTDRLTMHPYFYNRHLGLFKKDQIQREPIEIGHDAWIGDGVRITAGCRRIGIGAVVGAGSIVTRDVPDFTMVAGCPAKPLRQRFSPELQKRILSGCWWEESIDELVKHRDLMLIPVDSWPSGHELLSIHKHYECQPESDD